MLCLHDPSWFDMCGVSRERGRNDAATPHPTDPGEFLSRSTAGHQLDMSILRGAVSLRVGSSGCIVSFPLWRLSGLLTVVFIGQGQQFPINMATNAWPPLLPLRESPILELTEQMESM